MTHLIKNNNKIIIPISGMHCQSCAVLIEERLEEIENVSGVSVDFVKGRAVIKHGNELPDMNKIKEAVSELGYRMEDTQKTGWINLNKSELGELVKALIILIFVLLIIKYSGLLQIGSAAFGAGFSWPLVGLIGLAAGFSTCMALVGGLVFAVSTAYANERQETSAVKKFIPHLFFNSGRIIGFFFFGGLLGAVGSIFQLSFSFAAVITGIVGLFLLFVGVKLIGLFPILDKCSLTLPRGFSRFLNLRNPDRGQSRWRIFTLGTLTFFLPCGFTQAMQAYAVASGNFWQGGLIMSVFALGTAPGLLGLGGLASAIKGRWSGILFKLSGMFLIIFAVYNLTNASKMLAGEISGGGNIQKTGASSNDQSKNSVQIVRMEENSRGYSPNEFTIKAGVPVRWIINAREPYSCASSLIVPGLNIRKHLVAGENVIEFTPPESGRLPFSCSMGMYTGEFVIQ